MGNNWEYYNGKPQSMVNFPNIIKIPHIIEKEGRKLREREKFNSGKWKLKKSCDPKN